jgi:hypothetical protein
MHKESRFFYTAASCLLLAFCLFISGCDIQLPTDDTTDDTDDKTTVVTLMAISIAKEPTKSIYSLGETLDLTGIDIKGTYSDGTVKSVSVTTENCSGFSSIAYAMSLPVTVKVEGFTAAFNVKIIGDLVGKWGNGMTVKYTLNADLTASTQNIRGGKWSIEGDTLTMTYTETHDSATDTWSTTSNDPALQKWDVIVIDGKLRVSEPFYRIGTGTTLVDTWEQIAWHLDCVKVRLVVDSECNATYSIIPKIAFDKATGVGTWNYGTMYTPLTCKVAFPLPACTPGTTTTITISYSNNETIGPNGPHPITFFSANKMDLDAEAWERID